MRIPDPLRHYPPKWHDFYSRTGFAYRSGLFRSAADVNRFAARYRLAKAFVRLELDGYSDTVSRGYNALTRLMLTWSAFEGLMLAIGKTRHELSVRVDHGPCIADLRHMDGSQRYFAFVHER